MKRRKYPNPLRKKILKTQENKRYSKKIYEFERFFSTYMLQMFIHCSIIEIY